MRAPILKHVLRTLRSQWWSAQRVAAWQERALVETMRHACMHVPFYRDLGIDPAGITSGADLQRFPLIRKRDLQADAGRFLADGVDAANLRSSRTSGSTGEPTVTYFDADTWALTKYALKIRRTLAATSPLFRRCLIVSEQPPAEAAAYSRERPFSAARLYSERVVSLFEDMTTHRGAIADFRPDMLYAFPSYLLELERSYAQAGEPVPRIPVIFTSSEILTPRVRARIEGAFDARIHDIYGSTEFKEVAWQCSDGRYHLNFESVHVSISPVTSGAAPEDGSYGNLVLTTLCNRAMPLLRFQTGDLGAVDDSATCPCGRRSPQLSLVSGREGDVLLLPDGKRLSPYLLTTVIETLPGIHQYQIRHDTPTRLTVQFVAPATPGVHTLETCRRRLCELLGGRLDVTLERVQRFERGPGGKHKVFVREFE